MRAITLAIVIAGCTPVDRLPVPDGPEPDFLEGELFIGVDDVFAEMEKGAAFYMLDARPSVDYEFEHITGALEMPFYDIEELSSVLPKGVWYISYCSCPHSESGIVRDHLLDKGYKTAAVLDEGFLEWVARGYPTEPGG